MYFDAQEIYKEKGGHVMEITSAAEEGILNELLPGILYLDMTTITHAML